MVSIERTEVTKLPLVDDMSHYFNRKVGKYAMMLIRNVHNFVRFAKIKKKKFATSKKCGKLLHRRKVPKALFSWCTLKKEGGAYGF